jgi:hypothetical protein
LVRRWCAPRAGRYRLSGSRVVLPLISSLSLSLSRPLPSPSCSNPPCFLPLGIWLGSPPWCCGANQRANAASEWWCSGGGGAVSRCRQSGGGEGERTW